MSSKTGPDRRWSLTRRMAWTFAATTCTIVLLHGLWSSYYVFDALRDDIREFMEHELGELETELGRTDGTLDDLVRRLNEVLEVDEHPTIAFRVRDPAGAVVHKAGETRLLRKKKEALLDGESWSTEFFFDLIAFDARDYTRPPARVELFVDVKPKQDDVVDYFQAALAIFFVSVLLAGLAGLMTARRSLGGLRAVTEQARQMASRADITSLDVEGAPDEVREAGLALNELLARIQRGINDLRSFTAGLAHELRSPLMNLIGETEVTLLTERAPDEYRTVLRSNLEDLRDLSDAVDNLVAWCRSSDPNRRELRAESFDLATELEIRLETTRRAANRAGVAVLVESVGDTTLRADREDCLRLVKNLVLNAVRHSPEGAEVNVRVEGREHGVTISVEDQGKGVPDDLGVRIYEPFVSGPPREGRRAGYGLGLAICRSIVVAHGGSLGHENRSNGGGAIFTAEIPDMGD